MTFPPAQTRRLVRILAIVAVAVFVGLVARFWHPVYGFTAFLQVDADNQYPKIAAFRDYPVFAYHHAGGYDGQFYSQIAYDPTLTAPELESTIDNLGYRARRILMPAFAWLLATGRPAWIAQVYALFNVGCWFVLAALLWRLLAVTDARGFVAWLGLLFSVGVLGSVRLALTDLPALILLAAAVWSAERARPRSALGWLAAGALARETSLLAWPGLWAGSWRSPSAVRRNLLIGALAAAPLLAWLGYVRWRVGPIGDGWDNFSWPVLGFAQRWLACLDSFGPPELLLPAATTTLAIAGVTAQILFLLLRREPADPWWRVGAGFLALLLFLGTPVWEGFPGAAARVLLPLNLACNVLATRRRVPLAWLVACNLSIFAGLLALREVPHDRYELAAVRSHGLAGVLQLGPGWYGREENPHHLWSWTESHGRVMLECWPRTGNISVQATLRLQGLVPGTASISHGGRKIWSGPVAAQPGLTAVALPPLPAEEGRVVLDLATDNPPRLEGAGPGARRLGLALYDPVITLTAAPSSTP